MQPPKHGAGSAVLEVAVVVTLAFGLFIYWSTESALGLASPGPGVITDSADSALLSILWWEWPLFVVTAAFLAVRGWRAEHIGLGSPWPWLASGVALAIVATIVASIARGAFELALQNVLPLVHEEPPAYVEYSIPAVLLLSVFNSVYEEVFVVGYLITAVERWKGATTAILLSSAVRASYHVYQGVPEAVGIFVMGVLFGALFVRWRALGPLIVAHAVLDVAALA